MALCLLVSRRRCRPLAAKTLTLGYYLTNEKNYGNYVKDYVKNYVKDAVPARAEGSTCLFL